MTTATRYPPLAPAVLAQVLATILADLSAPLRVPALAHVAGLEVTTFTRRFCVSMGSTPAVYVRQQRMSHAAWLLTQTRMPLVQISLEIGLCDESYFAQVFTRYMGMTPTQYRRQGTAVAREPLAKICQRWAALAPEVQAQVLELVDGATKVD